MGNNEAPTPSKPAKAASPVQEQPAIHPYPDWAAMQAYYGAGVPMPPPYFSTTVAPGHAPHPYMWGPQPLVPPYGTPYTAIYPHGVYSHPAMTLGSHSHCQAPATSEAVVMASPLSTAAPAKSSNSKDRGLMKKLKGFDGLVVSIGSGNTDNTSGDANTLSQSGENGVEGSSDGSDRSNRSGGAKTQRKRTSRDAPTTGDRKGETGADGVHGGKANAGSVMSLGIPVPPLTITGKPVGTVPTSSPTAGTDFMRASSTSPVKAGGTPAIVLGSDGIQPDLQIQDERELKRERRKQSNRESARRSRLRKQAETEELAVKVEALSSENTTLRSEISRLKENSQKLKAENSGLMDKLKTLQEMSPDKMEAQDAPSIVVENFLSRIDKLREEDGRENPSSSKLHQLMDSNPRTDAVAAG